MFRRYFSAAVFLLTLAPSMAEHAGKARFNRDIRPILSNTCFQCHGPDEKKRDADLRLDTREGALADLGKGRRAIVPGNPDASEMLLRMASHDPDEVMPPAKSAKPRVTAAELALVRRWIAEGAEYEGHWAFLPPRDEPPPRPGHPVDAFVDEALQEAGLSPLPEADRATLLRRAWLDVTGLLPPPREAMAFAADASPDAYERMIDRLLASPHYGERHGRHWLDQARYADSNGYSIDNERAMWPYRDWVIKAFNDDMPFDRFTVEQLAGDLLPGATKMQRVATAFHRNTLINEEGGSNPEQFRNEAAVDRVGTTGAVWLGLTVACAQCHTHKYDPITHREYYSMFAFFNQGTDVNNRGAVESVRPGEVFGGDNPVDSPDAVAAWEKGERIRLEADAKANVEWTPAVYSRFSTESGATLRRLEDNSILLGGAPAPNESYRVTLAPARQPVAALRLRALTDPSLPKNGPGTAGNGNFVLTEFSVTAGGKPVALREAFADVEQKGYSVRDAIDTESGTGWAINAPGKTNTEHEAIFVLAEPLPANAGPLEIRMRHEKNATYLVGRFALELSPTAPAGVAKPEDMALLSALRAPAEKRTAAQQKLLSKTRGEAVGDSGAAEVMVMRDEAVKRETFIQLRGDFLRPDTATGPLRPGVIAAVNDAFPAPVARFENRLDLARWLVNADNPLTPRVTMNRLWMRFFGRGILETEEDFGTQGTPPTHPELLDWLGREFIRRGWSMKAMSRLILTSAAYRRSSDVTPELAERDPLNKLLARQSRIRVEAEIVRDAALSASGLLTPVIGGPGVRPPQPEGVYAFTQNPKAWKAAEGPDRYRRAMYTVFFRSAPYPLFSTFDAPDFQSVCTRRARSNTPLQALTMANDPAFLEFARALAARVAPSKERVRGLFLCALGRPPSEREKGVLEHYVAAQLAAFAADPAAAAALAGPAAAQTKLPVPETAALVGAARVVLNLDAFLTRE